MEEDILTRYTFVILLAIADPNGYVIGTDIAIARRLNISLKEFNKARDILMAPDPNSNSKSEDGKRLIPSDGERGYKIVNYLTYKDLRDENHRREYMREYMKKYMREKRNGKTKPDASEPVLDTTLNPLNIVKPCLAKAEAEAAIKRERDENSAIPTFEDVNSAAAFVGATPKQCQEFFDHYQGNNLWFNQFGKLIDVRTKLRTWVTKGQERDFKSRNSSTKPQPYKSDI